MKKIIMASIVVISLASCGNNADNSSSSDAGGTNVTPNTSAPSTLDSTTHDATGITNSNVISTDTAAMNNALPKRSMDRDSVK